MEKRVQDYTQDILAVVRSNTSPAAMSDKLGDFHANDIADAMPRLTVQERCKLYRILELDMLSDIFEYTDSDNAAEYVKEMDVKKGAAILSRMETDALVEVLHKIDKAKKKLLFELMDDDVRHDIRGREIELPAREIDVREQVGHVAFDVRHVVVFDVFFGDSDGDGVDVVRFAFFSAEL